jgi:hypothetical protein
MRLLVLVALLTLPGSAAFAFPASAPDGTKLGTACTGPLKTLAPKLRACTTAGPKQSRIWCPNGKAFDLDDANAPVPLARSLCELTQTVE